MSELGVDINHIEITPREQTVSPDGSESSGNSDSRMHRRVSFDRKTKNEDGRRTSRGSHAGDESSVYSTVDTLGGILEEIRDSDHIPRMVQMACERLREYMKGTTGLDDPVKAWADILRALLSTGDIEAIYMSTDLLKGSYGIPWAMERQEVLKILSELIKNPPNVEVEPEEQELLAAYGNLISALGQFIDEAVVSRLLWDGLFAQKSLFYIFGLAAVSHVDYVAKMGNNERVKFLHRLQGLLANSREEIFRSGYSETFNQSLVEIVPLCLGDISDGGAFADEVNRIINTCITLNLYSLHGEGLTAHGTCLLKILQSAAEAQSKEFISDVAAANLNNLYEWAVHDTPKACARVPEACHCKLGDFATASRKILTRISSMKEFNGKLSMSKLVDIYERHRTSDALTTVSDAYPHGKEEVRRLFPILAETLTKSEENSLGQDDLYSLLIKISRHDDRMYQTAQIDRLETRMGQYSAEVINILEIFVYLSNLNTPLMMGRGNNFHKVALSSPKPVDCVLKVNRAFMWMGCFSEDEAERVVSLMEKAYRGNIENMNKTEIVNSICASWKGIAEVHKTPIRKREQLVKSWTRNADTAEAAEKVMILISTSKPCCSIQ